MLGSEAAARQGSGDFVAFKDVRLRGDPQLVLEVVILFDAPNLHPTPGLVKRDRHKVCVDVIQETVA